MLGCTGTHAKKELATREVDMRQLLWAINIVTWTIRFDVMLSLSDDRVLFICVVLDGLFDADVVEFYMLLEPFSRSELKQIHWHKNRKVLDHES